jgi:pyrroloquinoline quinone (PQQ) biosynthesis protein C
MSQERETQALLAEIRAIANDHFSTPEIQYYLATRFTRERARCFALHQSRFVRNRRDCWALAAGQAPLDVKREIWLHEQDELIGDPRAGGVDHFTLISKEAELLGVSREEIESAELHPFVQAAFEAWLHLGKKGWLEAFTAVAIVEAVNSEAVVQGGGFSRRTREKLVHEAGFPRELLVNRNVHVEADREHAVILDRVIGRHARDEHDRALVRRAVKQSLAIHRAYRAGVAFAMRQIPAEPEVDPQILAG